jgi:hypothetical protein
MRSVSFGRRGGGVVVVGPPEANLARCAHAVAELGASLSDSANTSPPRPLRRLQEVDARARWLRHRLADPATPHFAHREELVCQSGRPTLFRRGRPWPEWRPRHQQNSVDCDHRPSEGRHCAASWPAHSRIRVSCVSMDFPAFLPPDWTIACDLDSVRLHRN